MRSAERLRRAALLAALAALGGCASIGNPLQALQKSVIDPVAAAITPAPAASAPAAAPVKAEPVVVLAPVDPVAQRAYDNALRALRAGRVDEAEKGLRALTLSHPDLGGPHANLGMLQRQAGKLPEAVASLEKAVAASPRQAQFHNQLGITYRHAGQFAKARSAYERAIELDPAYASPVLNLGILSDLYLGDNARAIELYDRYLALSGQDATVGKWLAELKNRKPEKLLTKKEQP